MPFALTTDIGVDKAIIEALTPTAPTPFKDVLMGAQKTLDELAKSLFFRRYIEYKIATQGEGREFIRIARDDRRDGSEWLVLTSDFKLKFWLVGSGALYDFDDITPDECLVRKATERLAQIKQDRTSAMRYLISRFGAPSFTSKEIQGEFGVNGNMNVVVITNYPREQRSIGETIADRIATLQFLVTRREILVETFSELIPQLLAVINEYEKNKKYMLFVLDLSPVGHEQINALFGVLPPAIKQRLWVNGETNYDQQWGYDTELMKYPMFDTAVALDDEQLLALLNTMFS